MHLIRSSVLNHFKDCGITELYHANSVLTSCQFLRTGHLLSRGTVERRGFEQTSQYSDSSDRTYSLWYDVFLDSVDIHQRAGRKNSYGPVLFVLDVDILAEVRSGRIWVTKCNPAKWSSGIAEEKRWFQSEDELREKFVVGKFDQMVVFRHCGGELPLKKYLKKIILDDPEVTTKKGVEFYSAALGALAFAMQIGDVNEVPIKRRTCNLGCTCCSTYQRSVKATRDMFFPYIF